MIWKQVVGYEGTYEVSEFGDVRRVVYYDRRERDPGLLRPAKDSTGYLFVALVLNGVSKTTCVHKIVAMAFLGPRPRNREINHKDADKLNNHYSNLEYITHADNIRHGFALGKYPIGSARHNSILTEADVREIRSMYIPMSRKFGCKALGDMYGVATDTVHAVITKRTWKHV